ncbi:MAG: metallophosphoesterase [Ignavibacteriae bacterium]|nr:MAG: metallophosphoesterase [Ignavibacteriota bacterium]
MADNNNKKSRRRSFITFFTIIFTTYGLVNFYIFLRGWQALAQYTQYKIYYVILFLLLSLSYIAGRFLERRSESFFNTIIIWIGSLYLAAMVYFLLILIVIDIFKLIYFLIPDFHLALFDNPEYNIISFITVVSIVTIATAIGFINAVHPRIKRITIPINKKAGKYKELKLALVTDIHLGTIISHARLRRIVRKINTIDADIVLLAGDVVDEDIKPVIKYNLGEILKLIKSKLGVYAITGNHEYIGGVEPAVKYLVAHDIIELRDQIVNLDDSFYIVGREDRSARGFGGKQRKPLNELMGNIDRNCPIILMDHQPGKLHEAQDNGVDLQVSGHTHHGQLFPFNFITKKIYELSYGYKKIGNTHYYVSCGVGTWGPPVRTSSRPEIVEIKMRFED